MWRVKGIKQSTYRIRHRYNCQRRCAFFSFCSVCASAQSEWYFVFVKRCILLEFYLKNILQSFEMWTKQVECGFSLSLSLSLWRPVCFASFCFSSFWCLFFQYRSSSFWCWILSSFCLSLSTRTKESIAAGRTGGMEAVLLFGPWCLLCKIGGGGCYWSTLCMCSRSWRTSHGNLI